MLEALRARLDRLSSFDASSVGSSAAARIEEKLQADATTRRGNVPDGITAESTGLGVVVTAPDWVIKKAIDKGQPEEWAGMLADEARAEIGGE